MVRETLANAARDWMAARAEDLLPVEYFHVVFTLPAEIARLAYANKKALYGLLFKASAETVTTIAAFGGLRGPAGATVHLTQAPRRKDRDDQRAPHLGIGVVPKARLRPNPTIRTST